MKKTLALLLALVLTVSLFAVSASAHGGPVAGEKSGHHEGWDKDFDDDDFDDDDFDDCQKPENPGHSEKPCTPTDWEDDFDHDDDDFDDDFDDDDDDRHHGHHKKPQRVTMTDVAKGDVTETDIFGAVEQMKHHGKHDKHFHIPLTNELFVLVDIVLNEDGTIQFGYVDLTAETQEVTYVGLDEVVEGMLYITMGDCNADGTVDAKDALGVLKHAVGKERMEKEGQQILADVNEDGNVDAKDALNVLKTAVGNVA